MSRLLEHTNFLSLHIQNMKLTDAYGCHFITLCHLLLLSAQVDLKFTLGEEKTVVYSNISVYPRVEGIHQLFFSISIFDILDLPGLPVKRLLQLMSLKLNRTTWAENFYSIIIDFAIQMFLVFINTGVVSPLVLNGDDLKLLSVKVNGKYLKVWSSLPFFQFNLLVV